VEKAVALTNDAARGRDADAARGRDRGGARGRDRGGARMRNDDIAEAGRGIAATFSAWGRVATRNAHFSEEEESLLKRAAALASSVDGFPTAASATRAVLLWSHPDIHPSLLSPDAFTTVEDPDVGFAQVMVNPRDGASLEVRLDGDDRAYAVRVGAHAILSVLFDELDSAETVVRIPISFAEAGGAIRFGLRGKQVLREP
jgi:hypothetical protein